MIAEKLSRFINNESRASYLEYSPDHARRLLAHFSDPHRNLRFIHIAGTNGKGSVAYMVHSILLRGGYSSGLYTSPHLLSVNERIMVDLSPITDSTLGAYIDDIISIIESDPSLTPTYFDVLTVCAFRHFHDSHVDLAVIEVGLGGRLDSTNVIVPLVSVITEISKDHASLLGTTPVSIAHEKAGIIKPAVPVVTTLQETAVMSELMTTAHKNGASLLRFGKEFTARNHVELGMGHRFDYHLAGEQTIEITDLEIGHAPPAQVGNGCCAVTAAILSRPSFPRLDDNAIRDGLRDCIIPGRFETLCRSPLIIFDPAHNESALAHMINFILQHYPGNDIVPVVTFMNDKDIAAMSQLFRARGLRCIYFVTQDSRCHHPSISDEVEDVFTEIVLHDETALFESLDAFTPPRPLFLFTGSFRLYRTAVNFASHCTNTRIHTNPKR